MSCVDPVERGRDQKAAAVAGATAATPKIINKPPKKAKVGLPESSFIVQTSSWSAGDGFILFD